MPKQEGTVQLLKDNDNPYAALFPMPVTPETAGFLPTSSDKQMATYHWPVAAGARAKAKGTIVLLHGYGDHLGRFNHVAGFFCEKGYEVVGADLPLHGQSEDADGESAYLPNFDYIVDAWTEYVQLEVAKFPAPHLLYSHGAGCLCALLALDQGLAKTWTQLEVVVYSAPLLRKPGTLTLHTCFCCNPGCTQAIAKPGQLTNYAALEDATAEDPLYFGETQNLSWARGLLRATEEAQDALDRLAYPVLVLQSPNDQLADPDASRELFSRASSSRKKFEEFAFRSSMHELHNEKEWRRPLEFALRFWEER